MRNVSIIGIGQSPVGELWNQSARQIAYTAISAAMAELPDDALHLVEVPALAISSTDCRERAEASRPIPGLEPLPSEPVYLRLGPSAFSHRGFSQTARWATRPKLRALVEGGAALGAPVLVVAVLFATAVREGFAVGSGSLVESAPG